jgi:hypothetical protein
MRRAYDRLRLVLHASAIIASFAADALFRKR